MYDKDELFKILRDVNTSLALSVEVSGFENADSVTQILAHSMDPSMLNDPNMLLSLLAAQTANYLVAAHAVSGTLGMSTSSFISLVADAYETSRRNPNA